MKWILFSLMSLFSMQINPGNSGGGGGTTTCSSTNTNLLQGTGVAGGCQASTIGVDSGGVVVSGNSTGIHTDAAVLDYLTAFHVARFLPWGPNSTTLGKFAITSVSSDASLIAYPLYTDGTSIGFICPGYSGTPSGCLVSATATYFRAPAIRSNTSSNTDFTGTLTLATGSTTSPTYTLSGSYSTAPNCFWDTKNATATIKASLGAFAPQATTTTISLQVATAPAANVTLQYTCSGMN